ncbi:TPA: hypothetical protein G8L80_000476 [Salmonella enterica]|uniref:hypothetical protein n=1 Tax=Salmonella enterica TaxID=28901 RepID=UPI0017BFBE84|nr:hypothetical protein [Salmonella enterica]
MIPHFIFQTADPACIRHAGSSLERLSQYYPMAGSQREAEAEQQLRLRVLTKVESGAGKKLVEKLQACRNDKPCGSTVCTHCQRERYLEKLAIWLPVMSASPGYACVELVFSEDKVTRHPWRDMTQARQQVRRYKQRISRTLRRLGHTDPVIGTFSLLRHRFDGADESTFWFPRLRLLLPDNRNLLRGLGAHMERCSREAEGAAWNIPMRKIPARDMARGLRLVLDPQEYITVCRLDEATGRLKTDRPELLKGRTRARSLMMMDSAGPGMLTFSCGVLPHTVQPVMADDSFALHFCRTS